ncbi:protein NnrT [Roseovarius aquimarinus]|uniref:Protein NnrT n=1 Tax=Roseovarius aquimarinus TaxID=1229156 RepID=A0ABW7IBY6_9RHOB
MRGLLIVAAAYLMASPALSEGFDRPIPQAQSATAEFWFAMGSIGLIIALILVQRLVARR